MQDNELFSIMSGGYGTPYITSGAEVVKDCFGFKSWDDASVISSVKTTEGAVDTERKALLNLNTISIPKGEVIIFGFKATKITLSAGKGLLIKAEKFDLTV